MADASADQLVMWSRESVIRELLGSIAMAVQRGNAMTFLEGYDRTLHAALAKHAASAKQRAVEEREEDNDRGIDTTEGEGESESEDVNDNKEDDENEEKDGG